MNREYETKVININVQEIIKKLEEIKANKVGDYFMRRWVYDINPNIPEWVRLRDNGEKVTLTYKKIYGNGIDEVEELETEVKNFDETAAILAKTLKGRKAYQESKRILYEFNGIEFAIDEWPQLEKYIEVESSSIEKVNEGLKLLGLEGKDIGNVSVVDLYKEKGIDLNSFEEFKFEN